jgi:hypothetical protein
VWQSKSRGTAQKNIEYCQKDGDWWEYGVPAKITQGTRTDLIGLREHFKSGKMKREAIEDDVLIHPVARYP